MSRSAGGRRMRAAAQCTSGDRPPPRRGQRSDLVLVGVHARPGVATGQPGKALPALGCNQALPMTALWGSPLPAPSSFGLSFYTLCCIVQSIPIAALSLFLSGALVLYALAHPSCSKSVLYAVLLLVYLHLLNSVPILGCILQKWNLIYSHLIVVVQSCVFIESFRACVLTCLCIGHCLAVPERVNLLRVKPEL